MGYIREVDPLKDVSTIAGIYAWYVGHSTATFELSTLTEEEMTRRILEISSRYPYLVWEENGEIFGYCYAHAWKGYEAYDITAETTIYLSPDLTGKGVGRAMMQRLIEDCRRQGLVSLIACITAENTGSCRFHESLGFSRVSYFRKVGRKFGRLLDVVDYQLLL